MTHIAVIDIGKTNAKLALVDLAARAEIAVTTRPNRVIPGPPWPHFDTEGHWQFILDGLRDLHARHGVDAISVTTHGASGVLLDAKGGIKIADFGIAKILGEEAEGGMRRRTCW